MACSGLRAKKILFDGERMNIASLICSTQNVVIGVAGLVACTAAFAVTQIHKCVVDAVVTYQSIPCSSAAPRQTPTVEQLNIERKKRAVAAGERQGVQPTAALIATGASSPTSVTASPAGRMEPRPTSAQTPVKPSGGSGCDGRKHCSQMTSCTEAKYFLANCPGVQMDGNRDGIPCEQQWCNR